MVRSGRVDGRQNGTRSAGAGLLLLGLMLALTLPAFSVAAQEEPGAERVVVAINGFENNLTPYGITFQSGAFHELIHLVHDSLFWSSYAQDPEPWLAESAEPNDDHTVWTVRLRDGLRWHDGESLTAADVAFTYDYFAEHNSPRYSHHVTVLPEYERSEVVDELTVELHFAMPAPTFEMMPAGEIPILPEHVWGAVEDPRSLIEELPVGSGPYEVVEMVSDERYVLRANEDYFKGAPLVDELVLPIVRDPSAAFSALQTGEIDSLVRLVPPELVENLQDSADVEVVDALTYTSVQIYANSLEAPTSDPDLRRALALAIDREGLVERVLRGRGQPGRNGFIHPDSPLASSDDNTRHDPEAAAELLDEAGYEQSSPSDTRRSPDGEPVELSVLVSSFDPLHLRAAELVAEDLGQIGVGLEVEALDPGTLSQRKRQGEFDLSVDSLEAHAHTDPDLFYHFFGPGITGTTFGGYENEEFNDLILEAAVVADWDQRLELIHQQQEFFAGEVPSIALAYPDAAQAYQSDAYDGWISDPGHGIFTKRSFLPGYAAGSEESAAATPGTDETEAGATEAADEPSGQEAASDTGGGLGTALALAAAALVAVAVIVGVARSRRAGDDELG